MASFCTPIRTVETSRDRFQRDVRLDFLSWLLLVHSSRTFGPCSQVLSCRDLLLACDACGVFSMGCFAVSEVGAPFTATSPSCCLCAYKCSSAGFSKQFCITLVGQVLRSEGFRWRNATATVTTATDLSGEIVGFCDVLHDSSGDSFCMRGGCTVYRLRRGPQSPYFLVHSCYASDCVATQRAAGCCGAPGMAQAPRGAILLATCLTEAVTRKIEVRKMSCVLLVRLFRAKVLETMSLSSSSSLSKSYTSLHSMLVWHSMEETVAASAL